jgi:hypothetical protein
MEFNDLEKEFMTRFAGYTFDASKNTAEEGVSTKLELLMPTGRHVHMILDHHTDTVVVFDIVD